jgi:hypothetical protein
MPGLPPRNGHAFRLVRATGLAAEAPRLWAAVYLHDLARLHDGRCEDHGPEAVRLFADRADLRALFARAGVRDSDYPAIGRRGRGGNAGPFESLVLRSFATS